MLSNCGGREVPLTARRSNQSILNEIHPKYSFEELMLKLQLQYLGHLDAKSLLIGKDAGKDWRQKEKGTTEDEMVGLHHWLNWHEFEQSSVVGDGQGSLACCIPWGHKMLDMTEWLSWNELTSAKNLFPIRSHCEVLGVRTSIPVLRREGRTQFKI